MTVSATSADGTRIAYDKLGSGPAVLIIGAGPTDRGSEAGLAELLAKQFTTYNYDRRGRGGSETLVLSGRACPAQPSPVQPACV